MKVNSFSTSPILVGLWFTSLVVLPLFIDTGGVFGQAWINYDAVFLIPKVWWIYLIVLPTSLAVIWVNQSSLKYNKTWIYLLVAWLIWLAFVTLFHADSLRSLFGPKDRLDGLLMHGVYSLCALAGYCLHAANKDKACQRMIMVFGLLTLPLVAMVALQYYGTVGVFGGKKLAGVVATVAGGTLGHRGYMGGLLALLLPFAVEYFCTRTFILKYVGLIALGFGIMATWTRGAWLAAIIGYIVWLILTKNWRLWNVHLALCFGVVIGLAFSGKIERDFSSVAELTNTSHRISLWSSAAYGILHKPVFGWGADGVIYAAQARNARAFLAEWGGSIKLSNIEEVSVKEKENALTFLITRLDGSVRRLVFNINKVHNEYLDYAVSYGILAAILFACLLCYSFFASYARQPVYAAAIAAYAMYLVTWPEIIRFAPIAWAILGSAAAFLALPRSSEESPELSK